jgi:hypothetical protein
MFSLKVSVLRLADTQQPATAAAVSFTHAACSQSINSFHTKIPINSLGSLLYTGINKEWSNSSQGGAWHCNKRNLRSYSLNVNNLGKAAVLHFAFCSWGHAKLSLLII